MQIVKGAHAREKSRLRYTTDLGVLRAILKIIERREKKKKQEKIEIS